MKELKGTWLNLNKHEGFIQVYLMNFVFAQDECEIEQIGMSGFLKKIFSQEAFLPSIVKSIFEILQNWRTTPIKKRKKHSFLNSRLKFNPTYWQCSRWALRDPIRLILSSRSWILAWVRILSCLDKHCSLRSCFSSSVIADFSSTKDPETAILNLNTVAEKRIHTLGPCMV